MSHLNYCNKSDIINSRTANYEEEESCISMATTEPLNSVSGLNGGDEWSGCSSALSANWKELLVLCY